MDPISALIGGAFSLTGGLMGQANQASINSANLNQSFQAYEGLGMTDHYQAIRNAAEKSGFNPLALLPGATTWSPPTAQVGGGLGDAMSNIGQNLSRLNIMASPHEETMDALKERAARASVENAELENVKLRHDITNTVGTPRHGRVIVGPVSVNDALRRAAGVKGDERLDFPFNVLGQAGNIATSAFERGTAALGRLIGGEYAPGGSRY